MDIKRLQELAGIVSEKSDKILMEAVTHGPYYIMNASAGIGKRVSGVEDIIEFMDGSELTIIAAQIYIGYDRGKDKYKKIFISGSGNDGYNLSPGDKEGYTVDTGRGYGRSGQFKVENIIRVDDEGNIDADNDIGMNQKRSYWVMK